MKPHIIDKYPPPSILLLPQYLERGIALYPYTSGRDNSPVTIVTPSFQRTGMTFKAQSMPGIVVLPLSAAAIALYCTALLIEVDSSNAAL